MSINGDLKSMVDSDIILCRKTWDSFSQDRVRMAELFNRILPKYIDKIEGFAQGMKVINNYERTTDMADIYRQNVELIISRLEGFKTNGYKNDGLREYYISMGLSGETGDEMRFWEARRAVDASARSKREKDEINSKIDGIEEICGLMIEKKKKWELLRPFVLWVSGKDADTALMIMRLFFSINQRT